MTKDQLFDAIRARIADPALRLTPPTTRPPRLYEPASAAALAKAERDLGFELPHLLRAMYAEIANGGFGPGYAHHQSVHEEALRGQPHRTRQG